ncbi:adenosylmethionine--8-amino-7-oxononanoate transaminase [Hyphococcus formosus]|uniref:adenosylmethionine--8-amino-7-oxononanoate transaminase n=1 Tax=Hyphococcus formosus TaxID=3143534 RepID=UPI00398ACDD9
MTEPNWLSEGLDHIWLPYAQMKTAPRPAAAVGTSGVHIKMGDGRQLIDGVASWWTAAHGYNHPHILNAVRDQLSKMPHVMLGGLAHEQPYRLAKRLAAMTPGDLSRVFFTESGSVAVEVAMKIAMQYWRNKTGEKRNKFVSFKGGYHGDTFATMSVCDPEEGMHSLFAGAVSAQHVVDLPIDEDAASALDQLLSTHKDMAAVLVEPLLQGAGGMRVHDGATLKRLRALCDAHGVLLVFDEIFTGFGRTGAMFASEKAGVVPDIMTLGKALTGGVAPLAATIASEKVYAEFHDDDAAKALMHGPTFCGHALGCAAANASLDLFETEPRLEQAQAIETALRKGLSGLKNAPSVADVRILGAMGAVELAQDFSVDQARADFIEMGLFVRPLGRVIYLTPSLTVEMSDLNKLIEGVNEMTRRLGAPS